MFITVKYGNNESLLCNPSCAVINLLNSIKRRTGYAQTNVSLDLSDEHGLVKELDVHHHDYATKYLTSHSTYVLVEKQVVPSGEDDTDSIVESTPPQYNYIPLLDNYMELFPNYRVRVNTVEKKKKSRHSSKSPSPAGVRGVKGTAKQTKGQRVPSRRR